MSSTVISQIAGALFFAILSGTAPAKELPPKALHDPVLGLKYPIASIKFDTVPVEIFAKCPTMADNENERSKMWVYAKADINGRIFYLIGGYGIRARIEAPEYRRYILYDYGASLIIEPDDDCNILGEAREMFDFRKDEETPEVAMQKLADDLAIRYVRAFGGAQRFGAELKKQRVSFDKLPPELQQALKPYFRQAGGQ